MPISQRAPHSARRIPPSGPPTSLTAPPLAALSALALVSSEPVPTTAGMRACQAGA